MNLRDLFWLALLYGIEISDYALDGLFGVLIVEAVRNDVAEVCRVGHKPVFCQYRWAIRYAANLHGRGVVSSFALLPGSKTVQRVAISFASGIEYGS